MAHRRPMHRESTYHSGSTSRSSYRGDRGDRMDRNQRQGRMNDFSYETRGHQPNQEYFQEREMRGTNYDSRHPSDYYSGRGGYAQDRYENASRQQYDRYNRDHDQRYFDEDYEGNRGFNRNYDTNSSRDSYGRQSQSRRPYDQEYRAYGRGQPSERMNRDWEHSSEDDYNMNRDGRSNYDRGFNDRDYSERYDRQNNDDSMRFSGGPETDWHEDSYGSSSRSRGGRGRVRPDYF